MHTTLPSHTIALADASGARFGFVRLSPRERGALKGDCIFDIRPGSGQDTRSDVRWLYKRRYPRAFEHRFRIDRKGIVIITQGDFSLKLEPTEDGMRTRPPAPPIFARWSSGG